MSASITDNRKRGRGRPPVGSTLVGVRFPPDELAALDSWINRQGDGLSRPEAVRRIVAKVAGK